MNKIIKIILLFIIFYPASAEVKPDKKIVKYSYNACIDYQQFSTKSGEYTQYSRSPINNECSIVEVEYWAIKYRGDRTLLQARTNCKALEVDDIVSNQVSPFIGLIYGKAKKEIRRTKSGEAVAIELIKRGRE